MNTAALRAQLAALAAILEAASGQVAALMEILDPDDECRHDNKQDISTMGTPPRYSCPDCGLEWQEEGE